jgi:YfiR/HmsC-like
MFLGNLTISNQSAPSGEYKVKAIFLFNFTQFAEWPSNPQSGGNNHTAISKKPFIIGIIGKDPYGIYLDETVKGEKVNNRPLVVSRYNSVKEMGDCKILFVSKSETLNLKQILKDLKDKSILTVSDISDFSINGGMIEFFNKEDKIGLRINNEAAVKANLMISSKLLSLAEIVKTGKK